MKLFFIFLNLSFSLMGHGQGIDNGLADTNTVRELLKTSNVYNFSKADTGLAIAERALNMARQLHFKKGEAEALHTCGEAYNMLGDYPLSIKYEIEAYNIFKELDDKPWEREALAYIGIVYIQLGEYREALYYFKAAEKSVQQVPDAFVLSNIGDVYDSLKMPDSALYYQKKAYELFPDISRPHLKSFILRHMGNIYAQFGKNDSAIQYYHAALINSRPSDDKVNMSMVQKHMSDLYRSMHQNDSALYYAREAFLNARSANIKLQLLDASALLASIYRRAGKYDSVLLYSDIAAACRDSLYGPEKFRQLQLLMLQQQQNEQAVIQEEEQYKNRIKYIFLLIALGLFLLLAFILTRNNRQKERANELLSEQKGRVENSLAELKSAQAQLVQREKMASLGELTAGIAHEIQNPLNFINNFSELNKELIEEASLAKAGGNQQEFNDLLATLKENQEKINQHGQRADAIVKGMLQHSRSNAGLKEPSNINALADEYLRLAYHGMRTKDKSFNATLQTNFDNAIGQVNIVPQDIGRVLLNLYNNAFYAIQEKKRLLNGDYDPTLLLSTMKEGSMVHISVKDNGPGISKNVVDKIFQPFFTTKPAGQGTGLGLSMSYDIVKAHGGEFTVETKEGEGAEFVVRIPIT